MISFFLCNYYFYIYLLVFLIHIFYIFNFFNAVLFGYGVCDAIFITRKIPFQASKSSYKEYNCKSYWRSFCYWIRSFQVQNTNTTTQLFPSYVFVTENEHRERNCDSFGLYFGIKYNKWDKKLFANETKSFCNLSYWELKPLQVSVGMAGYCQRMTGLQKWHK